MTIKLYNNLAENERVSKGVLLRNETIVQNVILKDGTSVMRPSLIIAMTSINFNYLYIEEFNRYYYIINRASIRNGLWRIDCRVDVLMSNASEIYDLRCIIARQENNYDEKLIDDNATFKTENEITYVDVVNRSVSDLVDLNSFVGNLQRCFVVSVASPFLLIDDNIPETLPQVNADTRLPSVQQSKSGVQASMYYAMTSGELSNLLLKIADQEEKATYIKTLYSLPFDIESVQYVNSSTLAPNYDFERNIYIANDSNKLYEGTQGTRLHRPKYCMIRTKIADFDFTITNATFLDYEPYTRYELYCPYYGFVQLRLEDIIDQHLKVYYYTAIEDGGTVLVIYNETKDSILFQASVPMAIMLSVNASNQASNNAMKAQIGVQSAVGAIASLAFAIVSAVTYNFAGVAAGIGGIASAGANAMKINSIKDSNKSTVSTGNEGLATTNKCFWRISKRVSSNSYGTSTYKKIYGLPSMKVATLSTLNGFTVVDDVHLEGFSNATADEVAEIKNLLQNGVILGVH